MLQPSLRRWRGRRQWEKKTISNLFLVLCIMYLSKVKYIFDLSKYMSHRFFRRLITILYGSS